MHIHFRKLVTKKNKHFYVVQFLFDFKTSTSLLQIYSLYSFFLKWAEK